MFTLVAQEPVTMHACLRRGPRSYSLPIFLIGANPR